MSLIRNLDRLDKATKRYLLAKGSGHDTASQSERFISSVERIAVRVVAMIDVSIQEGKFLVMRNVQGRPCLELDSQGSLRVFYSQGKSGVLNPRSGEAGATPEEYLIFARMIREGFLVGFKERLRASVA